MSVRATNRRERIRRPNGDRVAVVGGAPSTGLSAIAACATGVQSLSGAARAATFHDAMTPHAEAVVLFESLKGTGAIFSTGAIPAGVTEEGYIHDLSRRRDNALWSVTRCDVDVCDDQQSQAGVSLSASTVTLEAENAPRVYTWGTALARAIANAEANPAGTAWALTSAPLAVNMVPDPTFEAGISALWETPGATASNPVAGGFSGVRFLRATATGGTNIVVRTNPFGSITAGQTITATVWIKGTATGTATLSVDSLNPAGADRSATSAPQAITGAWTPISVTFTAAAGDGTRRIRFWLSTTSLQAAGVQLDVDAATTAPLPYFDGSTTPPGGRVNTWQRNVGRSATEQSLTPTGAYSRPVDATAPQLGLAGSKWVHKRTGALAAGDRITSPWSGCSYAMTAGRLFTIAGWVKVTPTGTAPILRWVLEFIDDDLTPTYAGIVTQTLRSEPFSASGTWARFPATIAMPSAGDSFADATAIRAHLEVVTPGTIGAGAEVSLRGVHAYAGPDRGDTVGLLATPLPGRVTWNATIPGAEAFRVNRVDVHGNDRISHVTSATGFLSFLGGGTATIAGSSPGRLTMRPTNPDDPRLVREVQVSAEEIGAGPGAQLAIQNIQAWHEEDVSADLVTLEVDRASDADPADSTIPLGNYAASTVGIALDDPIGEYELFGRDYIALGHRIEAAAGVVYTNRCDDPTGVDARAAGTPTLTWPTALFGTSPVVPVVADVWGQIPPAPYSGHATGTLTGDTPQRVTAPALEGSIMRGRVWVRYIGDTPPTAYAGAVSRYERPGVGIVVVFEPGTTTVDLSAVRSNVWTLVQLPAVTVPTGYNAVGFSIRSDLSSDAVFTEINAPTWERLEVGTLDVIEVVETAPAGIYTSTSWDAATAGAEVQVDGIDILATAGDAPLAGEVHVGTTVEAELREIARRYLDLGSDQVVISDQVTPLPFAIPAEKVSTQIADLAKVGLLTAYTDGLGRFAVLPRDAVDVSIAAEYLHDRNLEEASAALSPSMIRNTVRVTGHPASRTNGALLTHLANEVATDMTVAGWELSGQEVYLPPGPSTTRLILSWEYAAALSGAVLNPVAVVAFEVGQANPTNVMVSTTRPFPAGSTWAAGGAPVVTATLEVYPTFGVLTFTNTALAAPGPGHTPDPWSYGVYVDHLEVIGDALTIGDVAVQVERDASVEDFGRRESQVDVRLAQSTALLPAVGTDVLDNYSLRDPSGERWLPDLTVKALGDPWREIGDRVLVNDPASSISGEYRVVSHRFTVEIGSGSELYLRRVTAGVLFAVADVSLADDGKVTAY